MRENFTPMKYSPHQERKQKDGQDDGEVKRGMVLAPP